MPAHAATLHPHAWSRPLLRWLIATLGALFIAALLNSPAHAQDVAPSGGCVGRGQLTWLDPTDGGAITVFFKIGAVNFFGIKTPVGELVLDSNAQTLYGFCLDALKDLRDAAYCFDTEIADWRITYILTRYPPSPDNRIVQAGRQAALWHYTNSIDLNPANATSDADTAVDAAVLAVYNAILADVDSYTDENRPGLFAEGDVVLAITPAAAVNALPVQAAHPFTATLTKGGVPLVGYTVNVSTTLGALSAVTGTTDADGNAFFTVTSNSPGTANLGASASVDLLSGLQYVDETRPTNEQPLGTADPETIVVTGAATKTWVGDPGTLVITKTVVANNLVIPDGQTFSLCATGPAPAQPICKTFTYPNDLVQTWDDLPPGEYAITESGGAPFNNWQYVVVDAAATVLVPAGGTGSATVRNTALQPNIKLEGLCAGNPGTSREWTVTNDEDKSFQCTAQVVGGVQQTIPFSLPAGSSFSFTTTTVAGDNVQNGVILRCDGVVVGQANSNENVCNVSGQGTGRVGDRVWVDGNCNGLQDPAEINFSNAISVTLYRNSFDPANQIGAQQVVFGYYQFSDLPAGRYCLEFGPLAGTPISPIGVGSDPGRDSDVNAETGRTACFDLTDGGQDLDWDLGICQSRLDLDPTEEPGQANLIFLQNLLK